MDDRDIEDNNDDHVQIMTNGAMVSFLKRVISLIQNIYHYEKYVDYFVK